MLHVCHKLSKNSSIDEILTVLTGDRKNKNLEGFVSSKKLELMLQFLSKLQY